MPNRPKSVGAILKTWLVVSVLLGTVAYAVAENITLTTYYPSPRGMYKELRTTDATYLATDTTSATARVGIGITNPVSKLDVAGTGAAILHVAGQVGPTVNVQGAYIGWNNSGGTGETNFINNQGGGTGGFNFINTPVSGTPFSTLMTITGAGNVGIGTSPSYTLHVNGAIGLTQGANTGALQVNCLAAGAGCYATYAP